MSDFYPYRHDLDMTAIRCERCGHVYPVLIRGVALTCPWCDLELKAAKKRMDEEETTIRLERSKAARKYARQLGRRPVVPETEKEERLRRLYIEIEKSVRCKNFETCKGYFREKGGSVRKELCPTCYKVFTKQRLARKQRERRSRRRK